MTTTYRSHPAPKPASAVANSLSKRPLTVFAVCLALLVPGISSAKKPQRSPDAGCVVLLSPSPNSVTVGEGFEAKIVRTPSYTGHFISPKMYLTVTYPMIRNSCAEPGENGNCDWMVEKNAGVETPSSFYVTYMQFGFEELIDFDPDSLEGPNGVGVLDTSRPLDILGKVTEVLVSGNGRKKEERDTWCVTTNEPINIESSQ